MNPIFKAITWLAATWIAWMQRRRLKNSGIPEPKFRRMNVEDGVIHMEFEPPPEVISVLAIESARLLTEHDADNYVQIDLVPQCQILDPIRLTVSWAIGEMPAEKASKLEARVTELDRLLRRWVANHYGLAEPDLVDETRAALGHSEEA